jgi:hypothetical protein
VAELVDAADSKSAVRKDVLVRFQSRARDPHNWGFFYDFVFPWNAVPSIVLATLFVLVSFCFQKWQLIEKAWMGNIELINKEGSVSKMGPMNPLNKWVHHPLKKPQEPGKFI